MMLSIMVPFQGNYSLGVCVSCGVKKCLLHNMWSTTYLTSIVNTKIQVQHCKCPKFGYLEMAKKNIRLDNLVLR